MHTGIGVVAIYDRQAGFPVEFLQHGFVVVGVVGIALDHYYISIFPHNLEHAVGNHVNRFVVSHIMFVTDD